MRVTMEDLARAAGVSRSTVSRALADSARVKPETRAYIQQLARDKGYFPNAVARSLTTKRTRDLGVLLLDITEAFVSEMVGDLDRAARQAGYRLVLANCGYEFEQIGTSVNMLLERQVDAIIVADRVITDIFYPLLEQTQVPVISMNRRELPYSVGVDNEGAARQGVEHLLGLGHRRIGYIGTSRATVESRERQVGYEQALLSRGISPDPALTVTPTTWRAAAAGREGIRALLRVFPLPTALFCFNDVTAIGTLAELFAAGLKVPQNVSVLGFDDISLAPHTVPALTTLAQPRERMAKLVVDNALSLLAGEPPKHSSSLLCELIIRDSTAPPGTGP